MRIFKETDRIILREIVPEDAEAMFEMDANPIVHKYLGKAPCETLAQALKNIEFIRQQYQEYGIGRWAVVEKATNQFIGWSGLKFRPDEVNNYKNYIEVGYRLDPRFWGKGYATESAILSVDYGFEIMKLDSIYAMANVENQASINALKKTGLKITGEVEHNGINCYWFEIARAEWENKP
jgi:[ribosomal protein S5]-alanine N-acetyltransferase